MSVFDQAAIMEQRKLNNRATRIEVPKVFLDKFPNLIVGRAQGYFRRYLDTVMSQLVTKLPFLTDGHTYISTKKLNDECSTFNYKGKRISIWSAFKDIYPLFTVEEIGSNIKAAANPYEKNTRVKIVNQKLIAMLLDEKSPADIFDACYDKNDVADDFVDIDMENLRRYIDNTAYELEKATGEKHRAKLQGSLWQAQLIRKIGEHTLGKDGIATLPLVSSQSTFGRTYYKGINIQNVSKEVRSAIIGHHYQYDMNAAVFAIKLRLYGDALGGDNELVGTPKGTYTRQYLNEKNQIRKRLADHCFSGVNLPEASRLKAIKNALTSIGFGAKGNANVWMTETGVKGTALTEIILDPVARATFLSDDWVKSFTAEQKEMETAILAAAAETEGYEEMCKVVAAADGVNGKATAARKMSYLYQHVETYMMDQAVAVLARYGITPLARIHDAFLVREKLPLRVLDDMATVWGHREYATMDCEEVREWVEADYKRARDEADRREAEHREGMKSADIKARIYALKMREAGF